MCARHTGLTDMSSMLHLMMYIYLCTCIYIRVHAYWYVWYILQVEDHQGGTVPVKREYPVCMCLSVYICLLRGIWCAHSVYIYTYICLHCPWVVIERHRMIFATHLKPLRLRESVIVIFITLQNQGAPSQMTSFIQCISKLVIVCMYVCMSRNFEIHCRWWCNFINWQSAFLL
jgi:hypothetical protein